MFRKFSLLIPRRNPVNVEVSTGISWPPILGILLVLGLYEGAPLFGGLIISIYPLVRHWSSVTANAWVQASVIAQFMFILLAEAFSVVLILAFLRHYKAALSSIGLRRPKWSDLGYGLLSVPFYLVVYLLTVGVVSSLVHLNVNQKQQIGFNNVHGPEQLILTAISLVILPPIAEEIMVRGLLYSSLKKWLPQVSAALVTSALFASAHLPEGGAAGPLWIAALDTFVLSVFLILLRERTKGLWASMTLHASKNAIAYYSLFLVPLIHLHT